MSHLHILCWFLNHIPCIRSLTKEVLTFSLVLKCTSLLFRARGLGGWPYINEWFGCCKQRPMQWSHPHWQGFCSLHRPFLTGHLFCPLQAVVQMEGDNKLVTSFKGIKSITELNGDIITNVSWCSELAAPSAWGEKKGEEEGAGFPTTFPVVNLCYHLLRTHYIPDSLHTLSLIFPTTLSVLMGKLRQQPGNGRGRVPLNGVFHGATIHSCILHNLTESHSRCRHFRFVYL